ncbi:receptor-like protein 54 [Ziziphus jujuba]|uniref:Receptor-like protein 54 n=1 Tax=Ziziphus jujuba TaxID=326968 RepID=A0ABM4A2Y6_ZIZJJ|nr:receptor-like protein 54 [Ziziphus jujuba]
MPRIFGDRNQLETLDLNYNNLNGKIPKSLTNCKELQILNLGHNQMTDTFPIMLQSLPKLRILILSSNKFYGPIWHPHSFFGFANLHIIDLSFNDFTGSLPSDYFQNWTSMKASYNKGQEIFYVRILIFFISIDFSNNKFYGEIPSLMGDSRDLIVLNLSSNNFAGRIPSSLGNLIELESLDLSYNELSGGIPQQLTGLTFLGYLNLSNNQLTALIPQAKQIGTFSKSSFDGNWGLCGPPLSKNCERSPLPPSHYSEESGDSGLSGFCWKAVAIGYGCGFVIGLMLGHIITSRSPYLVLRFFV